MLGSLLRSPKCRQVGQIELNLSINGATGAVSGPDAAIVLSGAKNATGDYTITLKEPSKINLHVCGLVMATADSTAIVFAVTKSSVQIKAKSVQDIPVAQDASFNIKIIFMDQLSYYF